MNSEQFAHFFSHLGHRIYKTESSFWYEIYPFCWQSIPYHHCFEPGEHELDTLFSKKLALFIRFFSNNHDSNPGYLWITEKPDYDLRYLDTKTRNRTRRGLERTVITPVDFNLLKSEGWRLIQDTAARQGRQTDFASYEKWERYCDTAGRYSDFDFWGAFFEKRLISFLVGVKIDKCYYMLHQASETSYLDLCPNNALIYTIVQNRMADPNISFVSYGLESVEDIPGLRRFKQGMGFYPRQIGQCVILNPRFKWVIKVRGLISFLRKMYPQSNFLRKACGIFNQNIT